MSNHLTRNYSTNQIDRNERLDEFQQAKVMEYLQLVKWIVRRVLERLPSHIDGEDLTHSGVLGLVDAVRRFEWGRENESEEFQAYAECRIRGQVMDELRRHDILPRSARDKVNKYNRAVEGLRQELQREPKDQEVATYLDVDLEVCYRLKADANYGRQIPLDAYRSRGDSMEDVLLKAMNMVSPDSPEALIHMEQVKSILANEIERLAEREKQVISLYYLEELTLKEVGSVLSLTESRVSQIRSQAMFRLMKRLKQAFDLDISLERYEP